MFKENYISLCGEFLKQQDIYFLRYVKSIHKKPNNQNLRQR